MNFNLIRQIAMIIGRQITNITKKLTHYLMLLAKPLVYLNNYVRQQVKAMTRPPASKEDYVHLFGVYLSKRFLAMSVILTVAAVTAFSTVVYPWLEGRLWTPVIRLNSTKMASYTGPARIKNDMGVIIYEGDVLSGQLTGFASQYDTEGKLVYTGEFLNAKYDGHGSLYANGFLRYEGDFSENLYEGSGNLYNERGNLIYQGSFSQGLRSGTGMEYRGSTHTLSYYGNFFNDVKEGSGVAYEDDGITVAYRGNFAAGLYEGEGTYYEDGAVIYQGLFSQGMFEGTGTLYDGRGNVLYQGEFSRGNRQGPGTIYDSIGAALYTGNFLDGNVNYISYMGTTPEDIAAAFGNPGYTVTQNGYEIMSYLNLGTSFLFADDGTGLFTCDKVLVDVAENFLGLTGDTTQEELSSILGTRFSALTLDLTAERRTALKQMSIVLPDPCRADKYLFSTYYIKLYYDTSGETLVVIECGSY